jgi:hypothetical protein
MFNIWQQLYTLGWIGDAFWQIYAGFYVSSRARDYKIETNQEVSDDIV